MRDRTESLPPVRFRLAANGAFWSGVRRLSIADDGWLARVCIYAAASRRGVVEREQGTPKREAGAGFSMGLVAGLRIAVREWQEDV